MELAKPELRPCSRCGYEFQATYALQHICRTCVDDGLRLTAEQVRLTRAEERKRRLAAMGLTGRLCEMTFSRFDPKANPDAYAKARAFVDGWADPWHRGLALLGEVGTGKTHLACAIVHALSEQGVNCRYVYVPRLASDLKAAEDWGAFMRANVQPLREVDVLVLDDVGRERETPTWPETLDALIDARWVHGAPIVLTANLTVKQLEDHIGQAALSRFLGDAVRAETLPTDRRMQPIRVNPSAESQRDPTIACPTCDGAGWALDARLPVGSPDRLMKCPNCSGAGW